jgi:hypothetical protein
LIELRCVLLISLVAACTPSCVRAKGGAAAPPHEGTLPGEEPIRLELDDWWSNAGAAKATPTWRHAELAAPSGSCSVRVDRWWGLPPDTGGAAHVQSSRPVVIDGVALSIDTMSLFEGKTQTLEALYINDRSANARVVFQTCTPGEIDAVLARAKLSASVKAAKAP